MIPSIDSFIARHNLVPANSTIIIGLSGGPDSIFLLHLLHARRSSHHLTLIAAHLDHEWRTDSHRDAQFCQSVCDQLAIPLVCATLSQLDFSRPANGSMEDLGRHARRFFLKKVRAQYGATAIALAHHQDDQHENFFIRLMRGSGLTGLVGMKPHADEFIRPLLETPKAAIIEYLNKQSIPFVVDPTNESADYLRNRIRATALPALQACDPRFNQNFSATLARLGTIEEYLQEQTITTFNHLSSLHDTTIHMAINQLVSLHPVLRYRVILHWLIASGVPFCPSQSFLDEIIRFLNQPESGSHQLHTHWRMIKKKQTAYLVAC